VAERRGAVFRRWCHVLHRDVGYVAVGLTLVYAVTGLLLNHVTPEWSADFRRATDPCALPADLPADREARAVALAAACGMPAPKNAWWYEDGRVDLFGAGWTLRADPARGTATLEHKVERPILKPLNDIHLNRLKGAWTWVADVYALALGLVTLTGLFVLRGREGLGGRGKWLLGAGLLVPIAALALASWL
jgi:uncharacterized protein